MSYSGSGAVPSGTDTNPDVKTVKIQAKSGVKTSEFWLTASVVAAAVVKTATMTATAALTGMGWWGGILAAGVSTLGYSISRGLSKRPVIQR